MCVLGSFTPRPFSRTLQDSLLATPLILDLTILAELLTRVQYRDLSGNATPEFRPLYSVLSLLSYMLKAPLVKPGKYGLHDVHLAHLADSALGTDVVNSLNKQRNGLEQFLKACIGLEAHGDILLDTRIW
jgi:myo-inositol-1-phosphate synthase